MRNRLVDDCYRCLGRVGAGDGLLVRATGRWLVVHADSRFRWEVTSSRVRSSMRAG
jgi:hypothetical protein